MKGWHIEQLKVHAGAQRLLDIESLYLPDQAITLLTGPNGAGKTTLLETMAGLRQPSSGQLAVQEVPLWRKGKLQRQALLSSGVTLQHSHAQWFAATVEEELRYSLAPLALSESQIAERIAAALAMTGLDEDGLGLQPWHMSGGQQRRLALACAVVLQPRWLLLDEPTAGLDASGIVQLGMLLRAHRTGGGGALIVTHDWEALWPLADHVIEIAAGRIVAMRTREEMMSAWLQKSAMADPTPWMTEQTATLVALRQYGIEVPGIGDDEFISPEVLAGQIISQTSEANDRPRPSAAGQASNSDPVGAGETLMDRHGLAGAAASREAQTPQQDNWSKRDPRMLWAVYLLLSFGLLLQTSWAGLALGAILTAGIIWQVKEVLAAWRGAIQFFAFFTLFAVTVSSIQWSPLSWEASVAGATGLQFSKIFLIMLLGLALAKIVSPFRMQRGLEQGLSGLSRLGLPIRTLALTVSLIFRFIPLLSAEWVRFAKITLARGKLVSKPGRVPLRQLPRLLIPYLVSMLRVADEIAEALDVRGFGDRHRPASRLYRLHLQRADYILLTAGMTIFVLLAGVSRWLT